MSKIKELFKNKTMVYSVVVLFVLLVATISATYAYFTTTMTGTDGSVSIKSATINGVTFTAESITPSSTVLPGWSSGAKTITVSVNNTDYDIPYECTLNVSSNDITDMYLFVSGTNAYTANNGVPVVSGAMRLTSEGAKLTSSTKSTSMTYELKYKETGTDQSSQQGKTLSATVTCSLDGVNKLYYSNGSTGVRAIAYDSDGNPVTITIETVEDSEELKEAVSTNASSLGLTSEQASGAKVIGIDATVPTGTTATVKIAVSDVASTGETVALLHYDETNSAWEKVGDYVVDENGEITVSGLTSFSPFALVNKGVLPQVTLTLTNGTVTSTNPVSLSAGGNATFNITPNSADLTSIASKTCSNNVTLANNVITISNITEDTTCSVTLKAMIWQLANDADSDGVADVGDKITFVGTSGDKTESFYVISNDGTNINMLAEWNLYVGGEYNPSWTAYTSYTGIQSSDMKGFVSTGTPYKGTIAFSSSNYWSCSSYPCDLDLSSSKIATPLRNYKTYLVNNGADSSNLSLRLIKYSELLSLGCDASSFSCSSAPSWVYQTSFWSESASNSSKVWLAFSNDYFTSRNFDDNRYGVRPVVTIRTSDL